MSEQSGSKQLEPVSKKKSYKKPSFRQEKVFETRALGCGKINPTEPNCAHNRKNS